MFRPREDGIGKREQTR